MGVKLLTLTFAKSSIFFDKNIDMIFIVMDLFLFKSFVDCLILKKCELEMLALFRVDL
jgi:hypothetical protein